jgi:hypothetical protein
MGDTPNEWASMWGAKVKLRNDMPDDIIRDAIETSRRVLAETTDFDADGNTSVNLLNRFSKYSLSCIIYNIFLIVRFKMRREN